jgi:hypothetical protein
LLQSFIERFIQIADAFFHRAVVTGIARRTVEREHAVALKHFVDVLVVVG